MENRKIIKQFLTSSKNDKSSLVINKKGYTEALNKKLTLPFIVFSYF